MVTINQGAVIHKETDEQRGFADGVRWAKLRARLAKVKSKETDMDPKTAFLYAHPDFRQETKPFMKQHRDWCRRGCVESLRRGTGNWASFLNFLTMLSDTNSSLDAMSSVPDGLMDKRVSGHDVLITQDYAGEEEF